MDPSAILTSVSGNADVPIFRNAQFDLLCSRDQREEIPRSRNARVEQESLVLKWHTFLLTFMTALVCEIVSCVSCPSFLHPRF